MSQDNLRACFIVNPRSQGGRTEKRWGHLADVIRQNFGPFEYRFTKGIGDGANQARAAVREGFELIVAMGGDGTISEVADGLMDGDRTTSGDVVLGVIPSGTGGDFRRSLEIPLHLPDAAAALRGRRTAKLDVGLVEVTNADGKRHKRHFVNVSSFGAAGLVVQLANQSSKMLGGSASYLIGMLRANARYRNRRVRIRLDGGRWEERVIYNVAIANGRAFGGGMLIAPDARLDDGLFDVVEIGDFSKLALLTQMPKVYLGRHAGIEKVSIRRAAAIEAEAIDEGDPVLVDVDGESAGQLGAQYSLLPGALRIKLPERT